MMNQERIQGRRRLGPWAVLGVVAAAAAGGVVLWWLADHRRGLRWAQAVVRDHFPDVPQITAGELEAWLRDEELKPPVLWDVRTAEEHRVSHLRDAVHVPPETTDAGLRRRVQEGGGRPILCYCAAGYRGAEMARRLRVAFSTGPMSRTTWCETGSR
jgi:rhodanese-related sulfurtransferase